MKIKISQSKERNTIAKQSQLSSLNNSMVQIHKQESKHTKMSTNFTSNSVHINATTKKSAKDKKIQPQNKQKKNKTLRDKELMTSGRAKKLKLKINHKKSCDFQRQKYFIPNQQGAVSYRQYCLVQNSFVPVTSNEHQKLEDIMRSTADTTHRLYDLNRTTFRKVFPFKLKDSNSISQISQSSQNLFKKAHKVSKREVQIEASPFYQEIGIQYSERPQLKQMGQKQQMQQMNIKIEKQVSAIEVDIQTDEVQQFQTPVKFLEQFSPKRQTQDESLSCLLLKLQFKHLPNQKAFEDLSKNEKQHYSQLLSSLISKLNCSPRQIQTGQSRQIKTKQMIEIQEFTVIPLEQIKIKYEKLEMEVFKRESFQMNWMQKRIVLSQDRNQIDTSLMSVSSFLLNFFCYIELNYSDMFLANIKRLYGPSYFAQFQRVTRKTKPVFEYRPVLDSSIFQEFCLEVNRVSEYQKMHYKAVFDYINTLLDSYRPYYQHNGEPFPWAMKIYNSICEYVIDQNSLEIIFVQLKESIEKSISFLCGLIVDEKFVQGIQEVNPLAMKKSQRQNLLIQSWLQQKNDENHMIQCEATQFLHQVSEQIYNSLLLQVLNQKPFKAALQLSNHNI